MNDDITLQIPIIGRNKFNDEKYCKEMTNLLVKHFRFDHNDTCFYTDDVPSEVIDHLCDFKYRCLKIDQNRLESLEKQQISFQQITPKFVRDYAKNTKFNSTDKKFACKLLEFCVKSEQISSNWSDIEKLPFIPLLKNQNNNTKVLINEIGILDSKTLFRATPEIKSIIEPLYNYLNIIDEDTILTFSSSNVCQYVCKGLQEVSPKSIAGAIKIYLELHQPTTEWLKNVFSFINTSKSRNDFIGLNLLLSSTNKLFAIKEQNSDDIICDAGFSADLINDLNALKINLIHPEVRDECINYIQPSNPSGLFKILSKKQMNRIDHIFSNDFFKFVVNCDPNDLRPGMVRNLKQLKMFRTIDGKKKIADEEFHIINTIIKEEWVFSTTILYQDEKEKDFLKRLQLLEKDKFTHLLELFFHKKYLQNDQLKDEIIIDLLHNHYNQLLDTPNWHTLKLFRCKDNSLQPFSNLFLETEELKELLPKEKFLSDILFQKISEINKIKKQLKDKLLSNEIIDIAKTIANTNDAHLSENLLNYIIKNKPKDINEVDNINWVYFKNKNSFFSPAEIISVEQEFEAGTQFELLDTKNQFSEKSIPYLCKCKITPEIRCKNYIELQKDNVNVDNEKLSILILEQWNEISNVSRQQIHSLWVSNQFIPIENLSITHIQSDFKRVSDYFPKIPHSYVRYTSALESLGVPNEFSIHVIESVYERFITENKDNSLTDEEIDFIILLLKKITTTRDSSTRKLYAPNKNGNLLPMDKLLYNDMPWCTTDQNSEFLTHGAISFKEASQFGIRFKKKKILDSSAIFETFEQSRLSLVDQLHDIIEKDYTLGDPLLIELIQNADDARANEIEFILCETGFESKSLIHESLESYQKSSALYSFNDQLFSESDFSSIQHLQKSCKRDDTMKTGNFGLGWNVIYHITDKPSFISGNYWVLLDPLGELENGRHGVRIEIDVLETQFPDQLKPFKLMKNHLFIKKEGKLYFDGTLFRFPLRENRSKIKNEIISFKELKNIFVQFINDAPEKPVLFSNFISRCSCREFSNDNIQTTTIWDIQLKGVDNSEEISLQEKVAQLKNSNTLEETLQFNNIKKDIIISDMNNNQTCYSFLVTYGFIFTSKISDHIKKHPSYKFIPYGGVAMYLDNNNKLIPKGNVHSLYCTFPLSINSNLPVIINGRFLPTSNRRELQKIAANEVGNTAPLWNEIIMEELLSKLYIENLNYAKQFAVTYDDNSLLSFWPVYFSNYSLNEKNNLAVPILSMLREEELILCHSHVWQKPEKVIFCPDSIPKIVLSILVINPNIHIIYNVNNEFGEIYDQLNNEKIYFPLKLCSPRILSENLYILKEQSVLSLVDDANTLLQYLFSDVNSIQIENLLDIPIFPTFSNQLISISNFENEKLFLVDELESMILSNFIPNRLIMKLNIPEKVMQPLALVSNLQVLSPDDLTKELNDTKIEDMSIIEHIWQYLQRFDDLRIFNKLQIVPIRGSDQTEYLRLYDNCFSYSTIGEQSPYLQIFLKLGLKFCSTNIHFVHHKKLNSYLISCSLGNILNAIKSYKIDIKTLLSKEEIDLLKEFIIRDQTNINYKDNLTHLPLLDDYNDEKLPASKLRHLPSINNNIKDLLMPLFLQSKNNFCKCSCTTKKKKYCNLVRWNDISMTEFLYWIIFQDKSQYPIDDQINFSKALIILSINLDKTVDISNSGIIISENNTWCQPSTLYYASKSIRTLLENNIEEFIHPKLKITALKKQLGVLGVKFTLQDSKIIGIAEKIAINKQRELAEALFSYLLSHYDNVQCWDELQEIAWVICKSKPEELDIPDKLWYACTDNCNDDFCEPKEAAISDDYLGVKRILSEFYKQNKEREVQLFDKLLISYVPLTQPLLERKFNLLIDHIGDSNLEEPSFLFSEYFKVMKELSKKDTSAFTGSFMNDKVEKKWALNSNNKLCLWKDVIRKLPVDLSPYKFLPHKMFMDGLYYIGSKFNEFEPKLAKKIIDQFKNSNQPLNEFQKNQFIALLTFVTTHGEITLPFPILTIDNEIKLSDEVFYQFDWQTTTRIEDKTLVSKDLPTKMLEKFKICCRASIEYSNSDNLLGEPFGQKQELIHRIREVINEYQTKSIPIEFLQNADDAKASEIHFILEKSNSYYNDKSKLLFDGLAQKGPSLMVYNSSVFSEEDEHRITSIGSAGKRSDISCTGQFGIGIMSIYHITDCPIFVSGDKFYFFDPLFQFCTGQVPGRKILIKDLQSNYPDQLNFLKHSNLYKYYDESNNYFNGTVFRLSARKIDSEIGKKINLEDLCIPEQLSPSHLIFLKNIEKCTIFGQSKTLVFEKKITKKLNSFGNDWEDKFKRGEQENFVWERDEIVQIVKNGNIESTFLVVQSVDFTNDEIKSLSVTTKTERRIPFSGVACNINFPTNIVRTNIFSTLPLPLCWKSIPAFINGGFLLNSNRRAIPDKTDKSSDLQATWNSKLTTCNICSSYCRMLLLLADEERNKFNIEKYLPNLNLVVSLDEKLESEFVFSVWERIVDDDTLKIWSYRKNNEINLNCFKDIIFTPKRKKKSLIIEFLIRHGQPIYELDEKIIDDIKRLKFDITILNPEKMWNILIKLTPNRIPSEYSNSWILSLEEAQEITLYLQDYKGAQRVQVAPICDNTLKNIGAHNNFLPKLFFVDEKFRKLLPNNVVINISRGYFLFKNKENMNANGIFELNPTLLLQTENICQTELDHISWNKLFEKYLEFGDSGKMLNLSDCKDKNFKIIKSNTGMYYSTNDAKTNLFLVQGGDDTFADLLTELRIDYVLEKNCIFSDIQNFTLPKEHLITQIVGLANSGNKLLAPLLKPGKDNLQIRKVVNSYVLKHFHCDLKLCEKLAIFELTDDSFSFYYTHKFDYNNFPFCEPYIRVFKQNQISYFYNYVEKSTIYMTNDEYISILWDNKFFEIIGDAHYEKLLQFLFHIVTNNLCSSKTKQLIQSSSWVRTHGNTHAKVSDLYSSTICHELFFKEAKHLFPKFLRDGFVTTIYYNIRQNISERDLELISQYLDTYEKRIILLKYFENVCMQKNGNHTWIYTFLKNTPIFPSHSIDNDNIMIRTGSDIFHPKFKHIVRCGFWLTDEVKQLITSLLHAQDSSIFKVPTKKEIIEYLQNLTQIQKEEPRALSEPQQKDLLEILKYINSQKDYDWPTYEVRVQEDSFIPVEKLSSIHCAPLFYDKKQLHEYYNILTRYNDLFKSPDIILHWNKITKDAKIVDPEKCRILAQLFPYLLQAKKQSVDQNPFFTLLFPSVKEQWIDPSKVKEFFYVEQISSYKGNYELVINKKFTTNGALEFFSTFENVVIIKKAEKHICPDWEQFIEEPSGDFITTTSALSHLISLASILQIHSNMKSPDIMQVLQSIKIYKMSKIEIYLGNVKNKREEDEFIFKVCFIFIDTYNKSLT